MKRLQQAIAKVEQSIPNTAAAMRAALTVDELKSYRTAAADCFRPLLTPRERAELAHYKRRLRRGDALFARMSKLSRVGREAMRREQLWREASREYAAAYETLEQLLTMNPLVQKLLDRPFEESGSYPDDIARYLGSASEFANPVDLAREQELLRCQRSALLFSLARVQQCDEYASPANSAVDRSDVLAWDALFGFVEQEQGAAVIGDPCFSNTDASLHPLDEPELP